MRQLDLECDSGLSAIPPKQVRSSTPVISYIKNSVTSLEAAEAIEPKAGTLRHFVLRFIRSWSDYGVTDEEIQLSLHMDPSTERPRRVELVNAGFIKDSGRTRKTKSGRSAVVWIAVT